MKHYGPIYLDNITSEMWLEQCDAANDYFSYLEDMLVYYNDNNTYVTTNR
jgi:hypothetical protein